MGDPPHVDGVTHHRVHARGLDFHLADDVLAVLDALGIDRVKLVGHDWGGWIGFLLCLKAPQRFERYLALNILHPG
jgi:pimeloyl-ACP methyl ester carboxylesterase